MHRLQRGKVLHGARKWNAARLVMLLTTMMMIVGVLVLARSEAAGQSTSTDQKTASAPAGNAQKGKTIFTKDGCYECHDRDAQGGAGTGPRLGPNPIAFTAFANELRSPRDQMPPYTVKVLPDADLADIYAFVQSVPQPPKVDSIPLLK